MQPRTPNFDVYKLETGVSFVVRDDVFEVIYKKVYLGRYLNASEANYVSKKIREINPPKNDVLTVFNALVDSREVPEPFSRKERQNKSSVHNAIQFIEMYKQKSALTSAIKQKIDSGFNDLDTLEHVAYLLNAV